MDNDGYVFVSGRIKELIIKGGENIVVDYTETRNEHNLKKENIPLDIIYEDDSIIVINKQPGLVTHPAPGNDNNTLVNALLFYTKNKLSKIGDTNRPGIVHRLDKDTSGLLVVAKNNYAHEELSIQFKEHTIKRKYFSLVWGLPK